jgi:hypothetical protein
MLINGTVQEGPSSCREERTWRLEQQVQSETALIDLLDPDPYSECGAADAHHRVV